MALYQCLLFSAGVVDYWENLECDSDKAALAALIACAAYETWDVAELWLDDNLVHRLEKPKPR